LFAQNVSTPTADIQAFVTADGYVLPPPPSIGKQDSGIWHKGKTLILTRDASLPLRCVKCNAFTQERLKRKYSWHHPAIYVLLLVAWLVYLIVAMFVRKNATIELGLCEEHQARRRYGIMGTIALLLLGLAGFVVAIMAEDGTPALIGLLLLIAALFVGLIVARVGYPTRIDDRYVWLKGFDPDYLQQFPAWPGF
jgi:hypothetical protein